MPAPTQVPCYSASRFEMAHEEQKWVTDSFRSLVQSMYILTIPGVLM